MAEGREVILGVDPGLASTGVGVVERLRSGELRRLHSQHVLTSPSMALPARLERIFTMVEGCIEEFAPGVMSIESVFFAKNVRSAVLMAHGRGAAILAASRRGVEVREYSPLEIKQSVVGKGRATKHQVQQMVAFLLGLKGEQQNEHEADALACALCHVFRGDAAARFRARGGVAERNTEVDSDPEKVVGDLLYEERKRLLAEGMRRGTGRRRRRS